MFNASVECDCVDANARKVSQSHIFLDEAANFELQMLLEAASFRGKISKDKNLREFVAH
jgi:hypothetical protein